MAKVITFSRQFPAHHSRKGQPTYFPEKILNSLDISYRGNDVPLIGANDSQIERHRINTTQIAEFRQSLEPLITDEKLHTIRRGKRWKDGDMASLRVWSGKPYESKQIIIAPEVKITVKDIEITNKGLILINFVEYCHIVEAIELAKNDGLSPVDFLLWIGYPFSGQILIWNNNALPY